MNNISLANNSGFRLAALSTLIALALLFFVQPLAKAQKNRELQAEEVKSREKRLALVIGNGSYTDSPLSNPVNDAADMAAMLKRLGFEVTLLTNSNQIAMKRAIRSFGEQLRGNNGVGLFYYAGHGVQVKGENYLIPVGAAVNTEEEVEYEGINVGLVLAQMESAKNKMNIVILDACRNNPFARSFRSADKGLASIDAPSGTLLAYSTAPGSVASDGKGRNGLYTQELLKQMQTSGLSIEDVFKRVRVSVRDLTQEKQTPWESSSLTGDFYFSGKPEKTTPGNSSDSSNAVIRPEPVKIAPLPSTDEVFRDYYKAVGGERAKTINTVVLKGVVELAYNGQNFSGTIESYVKFPGKLATFMKFTNGNSTKEIFDGSGGWIQSSVGGTKNATPQQITSQKRSMALAFGDVDAFKSFYSKITVKHKETFENKEVVVVEATTMDDKTEKIYFDTSSKLIRRWDFSQTSVSTQQGISFTTEVYFEDYVSLDGVQIPLITRQKVSTGMSIIIKYNLTEIKYGVPLEDKLFKKP